MPATANRKMNEAARGDRHRYVSDVTVIAIREEQQVRCPQCIDSAFDQHSLRRLLPRITQQLYAVKSVYSLHHS